MIEVNQKMTTEARDGMVYIKSQKEHEDGWQDEMAMKPNNAIELASLLIQAAGNCNE